MLWSKPGEGGDPTLRPRLRVLQASHKLYTLGVRHQPAVLTVLAVDNEIILASSQKGPGFIAYWWTGSRVKEELEACQRSFREETRTETRHSNDGKCGEAVDS